MKKKRCLLIAVITLNVALVIGCVREDKVETKDNKTSLIEVIDKEENPKTVDEPDKSQQISSLPWENDTAFKERQLSEDTDVLIAGFCTVLEKSTPEERENIRLAAEGVKGTVLAPGEVFSQNKAIGPYTQEKGYKEGSGYVGNKIVKSIGGGVCKVATTLYNTSVSSGLEVVERHNHAMPVPYVPYGQDAAVAYGFKDFKFKNTTDHKILIWTQIIENRVYMGFYGKEKGPDIVWKHHTLSTEPSTTEYKQNKDLGVGEEKVVIEGMDGEVLDSKVEVRDKDGSTKTIDLGKSSYLPMTRIIEKNN